MKIAIKVISLGLFVTVASPALADWQYTKWGMMPGQVVANSNGAIAQSEKSAQLNSDGFALEAQGVYAAGDYSFDALFYFKNDGLALVTLKLRDAMTRCAALANDLEGRYGRGVLMQDLAGLAGTYSWQDRPANNAIKLVAIKSLGSSPAVCAVDYRPLVSPSGQGL